MEKKFNSLTEIAATLLADYQTNYFSLREINSHLENLDQLSNGSIRNAITDAQRQMLAFLVNTAENKSAEAQQDVIDFFNTYYPIAKIFAQYRDFDELYFDGRTSSQNIYQIPIKPCGYNGGLIYHSHVKRFYVHT